MHADLNANNILLDTTRQVYLVDFDKSSRGAKGSQWKQANLQRLKRSLNKLLQRHSGSRLDWPALESGYNRSDEF